AARVRLLVPMLAIAVSGCALAAAPAVAGQHSDVISPLDVSVLAPPQPVLGTDGRRHMLYELQVHNWTSKKATIQLVQVRVRSSGRLLAAYTGPGLSDLLVQEAFAKPLSRTLVPGEGTILW